MARPSPHLAHELREAARAGTLVRIAEAAPISYDPRATTSALQTLVIAEGQGSSGYYPAAAIESIVALIDGVRSFYDHPSKSDEVERPERQVRDICGWFSDGSLGTFSDLRSTRKLAAAFAVFHPRDGDATIAGLLETTAAKASQYPNSEPFAALSVIAIGVGADGTSPIDGRTTRIISKFLQLDSIDVVTTAGRLGRFFVTSTPSPVRRESVAIEGRRKNKLSYLDPLR